MSAFLTQLAVLNDAVESTFGSETISYQPRVSGVDFGSPVDLISIPIDPLRLEGLANGNFAVRWVKTVAFVDWVGNPFIPGKGDVVVLATSALTVGGIYTVFQVQADIGGGVRLILEKRG